MLPWLTALIFWESEETGMLAELIWSQRQTGFANQGAWWVMYARAHSIPGWAPLIGTSDWMLCTLPGFAWAKGEGTARANFRGFISFSVSHVKKGTLTLEVICVEEFLIMKGLWMLFRGGWVEPHQVFNCFLGVRLPWRSVISPDLFEKITYSYSFTKCTWPQGPWPIPNELSDWSEAVEQLTASSLCIFWFLEAPFIWHHHGKIREGGLGSWRSTGLGSHLWSLFSVMCRLCYCTLEIYLIL